MLSTFSLLLLSVLISGLNSLEQRDCGFLPFNLYGSSVIHDGNDSLYYVGGYSDFTNRRSFVYKYDVSNSTFNPVPLVEFPGAVAYGVTALDKNGNIFHFGGSDGRTGPPEVTKDIYRFNIHTLELELLEAKLNVARHWTSSITVGHLVFIFSGDDCNYQCESTFEQFNMVTKRATVIGKLDIPFYHRDTAVVYDGKYAYIFRILGSSYTIPVLRFDPATHEQKVLETPIPRIFGNSAAIAGRNGYFIHEREDKLVVYNTEKDEYSVENIGRLVSTHQQSRVTYAEKQNMLILSVVFSDHNYEPRITCIDLPPKPFECTEGNDGLFPHPEYCSKFIICSNGQKHEMNCPGDLHFDPIELICDYPENANCTV